MFIKDIDQHLRFDVKSQIKLISFNNIEIVIITLQNIKKFIF